MRSVNIPNWLAGIGFIVFLPFAFLAFVGLFYIVARGLGGKGPFLGQAYATVLYYVPVVGISTIAYHVPFVGHMISEAFFLYEFVLTVFAIAASHRFTVGRSVFVVVAAPILLFLLLFVLVIVYVILGIIFHRIPSPH